MTSFSQFCNHYSYTRHFKIHNFLFFRAFVWSIDFHRRFQIDIYYFEKVPGHTWLPLVHYCPFQPFCASIFVPEHMPYRRETMYVYLTKKKKRKAILCPPVLGCCLTKSFSIKICRNCPSHMPHSKHELVGRFCVFLCMVCKYICNFRIAAMQKQMNTI